MARSSKNGIGKGPGESDGGGRPAKNTRRKNKLLKAIALFTTAQVVGWAIGIAMQRGVLIVAPPPPSSVRMIQPTDTEIPEKSNECPFCGNGKTLAVRPKV